MENLTSATSAISVLVDTHDKEIATDILKNLGLNMSTFVNMAIKQLLYTNGLPFEVKNPTANNEEHEETEQDISQIIKNKSVNDYDTYTIMPNLPDFLKSTKKC